MDINLNNLSCKVEGFEAEQILPKKQMRSNFSPLNSGLKNKLGGGGGVKRNEVKSTVRSHTPQKFLMKDKKVNKLNVSTSTNSTIEQNNHHYKRPSTSRVIE